jgi:hypothetical protein
MRHVLITGYNGGLIIHGNFVITEESLMVKKGGHVSRASGASQSQRVALEQKHPEVEHLGSDRCKFEDVKDKGIDVTRQDSPILLPTRDGQGGASGHQRVSCGEGYSAAI